MGLDCTHGAWSGAYSAFMRWREKLAEVAGLPPLELMEGFYMAEDQSMATLPFVFFPRDDDTGKEILRRLAKRLPIKWECLKPDPLYELLYHSDCDGEIPADHCGPIADSLEKLIPLLPPGDDFGHIGNWRDKTAGFVAGLREAAAANEPLGFH